MLAKIAYSYEAPDVWEVLRNQLSISHEVNRPEVQEQIRWLMSHPSYVNKVCRQSEPYIYHIVAQIKKRHLPGELALLPMIESAFDPFAYSGKGAAGLWQLMPKTGNELGLKQDWWSDARRSIGPSTNAALNYLVYLNRQFNGHWILAIASYDAGEGTISRAIKATAPPGKPVDFWNLPMPDETKVYVPRLFALAEIINNPARYHVSLPVIPYLPYFEEVSIDSPIDLSHAAKLAGISYKELIKLNPGFNRWTTNPYKPFKLLLPAEKVERFNFNLSNIPAEQRVSWTKLTLLKGDMVNNIATRYHTTATLIKQVNQLNTEYIKPNQTILIPNANHTTIAKGKEQEKPAISPLVHALAIARNHRLIHIVQDKDTYQTLYKLYGVSAADVKKWNKLSANAPLKKGQQLVLWKTIKPAINYVVKPGDTLSTIAKQHQTKIQLLLALNPEIHQNQPIHSGQRLLVR